MNDNLRVGGILFDVSLLSDGPHCFPFLCYSYCFWLLKSIEPENGGKQWKALVNIP